MTTSLATSSLLSDSSVALLARAGCFGASGSCVFNGGGKVHTGTTTASMNIARRAKESKERARCMLVVVRRNRFRGNSIVGLVIRAIFNQPGSKKEKQQLYCRTRRQIRKKCKEKRSYIIYRPSSLPRYLASMKHTCLCPGKTFPFQVGDLRFCRQDGNS
ncbi:hypothetical protein BT96DRAFT_113618 [Gymnopus androsaceus JB14]|uniref:Uncharacterized protein n=1 Tax=Gymnopus androsaceus JB14 TaxID=1447944 RepID=A0A6A4HDH4_9AGAR|nr:hypothetical protein BT96DRAFT_113618 [Gymnopus androsaceus JB14]